MGKLKGFGYYRTSGEIGVKNKGYGYSSQKKDVRDFCKENGIELVDEFFSNGVSGCSYEDDSQLQEMLSRLDEVDVIVSKDTSRILGRGDFREIMTRREVMKLGKKIFLTDTPEWDLYEEDETKCFINGFMSLLDRFERSRITNKLTKSRRNKVISGKKGSGKYPLGYKKDKETGETIVNPTTKVVVEFLYQSYNPDSKNETLSGLSRQVKEKWDIKLTPSGILKILSNRWYIGEVTMGETTSIGTHETFITKNRFGRIQTMLSKNKKG